MDGIDADLVLSAEGTALGCVLRPAFPNEDGDERTENVILWDCVGFLKRSRSGKLDIWRVGSIDGLNLARASAWSSSSSHITFSTCTDERDEDPTSMSPVIWPPKGPIWGGLDHSRRMTSCSHIKASSVGGSPLTTLCGVLMSSRDEVNGCER